MEARFYQKEAIENIYQGFQHHANYILYTLATGGGKTVIATEVIKKFLQFNTCAIAHRQELVGQISMSLAANGIEHRIIADKDTIRNIANDHREAYGRSWYVPDAKAAVASIDTLIKRTVELKQWMESVAFWFIDEAHHVLRENKWGSVVPLFPNAKGLGVTATACRADGKGLGAHNHGVFEMILQGIGMRPLINLGYLTDYRIIAPANDLDYSEYRIGATGDISAKENRKKIKQATGIIGDIVKSYLEFARGKRGVTFVPDHETAQEVCDAYNAAGVPAEVVTNKTKGSVRKKAVKKLKTGELLQLVNVDLFGEGFDLPAIEVVSMARRTESYAVYAQQFGRALRLMIDPALMERWEDFTPEERLWHIANSVKPSAIIIDHVSNWERHGLPDKPRVWDLEATSNRGDRDPDDLPIRRCMDCALVFESWEKTCPFCGYKPVPEKRTEPKFVEGDLTELPPEVLKALREEVEESTSTAIPYGASEGLKAKRNRDIQERLSLIKETKQEIDAWAGRQMATGLSLSATYMKFYKVFNIDAIRACAQPTPKLRLTLRSLQEKRI